MKFSSLFHVQLNIIGKVMLSATAAAAIDLMAAETGYVQNGLVARYDGIENAGVGRHSAAPSEWKDLAGTNNLPVVGDLSFKSNCGAFSGYGYCYGKSPELARLIESRTGTVEVVTRISSYVDTSDRHLLSVGFKSPTERGFSLRPNYRENSVVGCCDYMRTDYNLLAIPSTVNEINTHTIIMDGSTLRFAQNGVMLNVVSSGNTLANIPNDRVGIGQSEYGLTPGVYGGSAAYTFIGDIYSVRFYDRILTAEEIAQNRRTDHSRFSAARGESEPVTMKMKSIAYSPNELLAHFDGIENAVDPGTHRHLHAFELSTWTDLAGENNLRWKPAGTISVASNHVEFAGGGWFEVSAPRVAAAIQGGTCTVEVVTRIADYTIASDLHLLSVGFKSRNARGFSLRPNYRENSVIGCCDYMRTDYNLLAIPSTVNEINTHTIIMDGGTLRFAQNGVMSAVTSSRGDLAEIPTSLLSIGSSEVGNSIFKGEVYAVRIYGRVLTTEEIALHRAVDLVRFCGRKFSEVRPAVLPRGCHVSSGGSSVSWGPPGFAVIIF